MKEPLVPYLLSVRTKPDRVQSSDYPFHLPLIRSLDFSLLSPVAFFVGENGTGKSTVMEAIAALCRLPVSGGSRNELHEKHGPESASPLASALRPSFRKRPSDGYFLRAEFQAHFASLLDARNADPDFRRQGDPYERVDYGLTKLLIEPGSERVLGVGIVGPGAGELIAEGTLAIEMGAVVSDLKLTIHAHPTLSETVMESAEVFFGQSTHVYKPKRKA
jgi:hypothetical protein